jgi:hypothetical protein
MNGNVHLPSATTAMLDDTPLPWELPSVRRKKLTFDFDGGIRTVRGAKTLHRRPSRDLRAMTEKCSSDKRPRTPRG